MLNTWGFREREREIIFTFFIVFPLLSFLRSSNLSLYLSLCCLVYDYRIKKEKISKGQIGKSCKIYKSFRGNMQNIQKILFDSCISQIK